MPSSIGKERTVRKFKRLPKEIRVVEIRTYPDGTVGLVTRDDKIVLVRRRSDVYSSAIGRPTLAFRADGTHSVPCSEIPRDGNYAF
jgi:hypothetical protein